MQKTLKDKTIFTRDNLEILRGIDGETMDLIYLDPPFNKNQDFTAPIGTTAEGASFRDIFKKQDVKASWIGIIAKDYPKIANYLNGIKNIGHISSYCYLSYMAIRLIEMYRVLKPTGSLYFHCDHTIGCHLRLLLDCIFGENNHRGHIIWKRHTSVQKGSQYKSKSWGSTTDYILHYTKTDDFFLNSTRAIGPEEVQEKFPLIDEKDERYHANAPLYRGLSMGDRPNLCYEWRGFKNPDPSGWRLSKERLEEEYHKGNVVITEQGKLQRRKYLKDYEGVPVGNIWTDIPPVSRKIYPTQKPLDLLKRIIQASSAVGDWVLDPFCGCATTCVAAQLLDRKWIGIDISKRAFDLVKMRLAEKLSITSEGNTAGVLSFGKVIHREDIPQRTDIPGAEKPRKETKQDLYGRQEGICNGCEQYFPFKVMEIDHVVSQSKGGGDNEENLQLLCSHCNRSKSNRTMEAFMNEQRKYNK